jgi:hypothetical protein
MAIVSLFVSRSLPNNGPICHSIFDILHIGQDLCGLMVRVLGYRSRNPGLDFGRYQIFWEVVGLERGPLSLVMVIEELLEWKSSGSGLENQD